MPTAHAPSRDASAATHDVVVLGGGPAGYACALRAADLRLTVAVVEADAVGGTCLHRGCVPTRSMLQAAAALETARTTAPSWGIATTIDHVDVGAVLARRDDIVARNHRAVIDHLAHARVEVVRGKGWLAGPREVVVDGRSLRAGRGVVLATGSVPRIPDGLTPDGRTILTSDQALALDRIPRSVVLVGAGAVGAELSQVWRAFGAEVHLVEIGAHLVPHEDAAIGRELARMLRHRGIHTAADTEVVDVRQDGEDLEVALRHAGRVHTVRAEMVVLSAGRTPRTEGIGLEAVGVALDGRAVVPADLDRLETTVPGVHAIGDLLPPPSLMRAHVALAEGMLVAEALAGGRTSRIDQDAAPRITHGITETAAVGLSEERARAAGHEVVARTLPLGQVAKGLILDEGGLVKVVAERDGRVLGIHLVGPHVTELVGEATAITAFEATPFDVATLIHPHPTLVEAIGELHLALAGRRLHLR